MKYFNTSSTLFQSTFTPLCGFAIVVDTTVV